MTSKVQTSRESPQILSDRTSASVHRGLGRHRRVLTPPRRAAYGGAVPPTPEIPADRSPAWPPCSAPAAEAPPRPPSPAGPSPEAIRAYTDATLLSQSGKPRRGRRPLRRRHAARPGGRPGLAGRGPRPHRPARAQGGRRTRPGGHQSAPRPTPTSAPTPPPSWPRPATWTRPASFTRPRRSANRQNARPGCGSPRSPSIAPSSKRPKRR